MTFKNKTIFIPTKLLLAVLPVFFIYGCGQEVAPEPPIAKSKLTLEIFKTLKNKQHQTAYNKINRLIAMDKDDQFLYKLKNTELNNIYIEQAQQHLAKNDIAKAITALKKAELLHGRNKHLHRILKELKFIHSIELLVKKIKTPENGTQLKKDTMALIKLLKDYKPAKEYLPFLYKKLEQAKEMQQMEAKRAIFSLYSDLAILSAAGDKEQANTLIAILDASNVDQNTWMMVDYLIKNSKKQ